MSLYQDICSALRDRADWEKRQSVWYEMRHNGLRRVNKPYPGAPDTHFPLIDASIDKHKPFYLAQMYATETLAAFVGRKQGSAEAASEVGSWFDYQLKQESNFEREAICGIDALLQSGGCPIKVFWNDRCKKLEFDACNPLHVIVPKWTEEIQEADFLVHVLHLSEAQYRYNKTYNQDPELIKTIKGRGSRESGDNQQSQEKAVREGITVGQDAEQIVLWEVYTRDPSKWDRIIVKTRSPLRFDDEIRADFELPYTEGVFKTRGWFPFVKWRGEIKDKGYYSSRGLAEIQGSFEQALSKFWNFKYEWMDFFVRPQYEQDANTPMTQTGNIPTGPGSIMPPGLRARSAVPLPPVLAEEMNMLRQLAEYRVQAPDFGVLGEHGGKRTATEISAISGQTSQGVDMRARIFRLDLNDTYLMAWAVLMQFGKESLVFTINGESKSLDEQHLTDAYELRPNGSADSWNKGAQLQKAIARMNMFKGSPYVKQGELTKSVLELDEPGLVPRLYQEPQDAQAGEAEEQAMEISIMLMGFPAAIDPTDDDKIHLTTLAQYVEQTLRNQEALEPRFARLALKHGAEHTDALMQKKDPAARQINRELMPVIQVLQQIAQQPDPREIAAQQAQMAQQQAMGNVVPMAPVQQGQQGPPVAGSAAPSDMAPAINAAPVAPGLPNSMGGMR